MIEIERVRDDSIRRLHEVFSETGMGVVAMLRNIYNDEANGGTACSAHNGREGRCRKSVSQKCCSTMIKSGSKECFDCDEPCAATKALLEHIRKEGL